MSLIVFNIISWLPTPLLLTRRIKKQGWDKTNGWGNSNGICCSTSISIINRISSRYIVGSTLWLDIRGNVFIKMEEPALHWCPIRNNGSSRPIPTIYSWFPSLGVWIIPIRTPICLQSHYVAMRHLAFRKITVGAHSRPLRWGGKLSTSLLWNGRLRLWANWSWGWAMVLRDSRTLATVISRICRCLRSVILRHPIRSATNIIIRYVLTAMTPILNGRRLRRGMPVSISDFWIIALRDRWITIIARRTIWLVVFLFRQGPTLRTRYTPMWDVCATRVSNSIFKQKLSIIKILLGIWVWTSLGTPIK